MTAVPRVGAALRIGIAFAWLPSMLWLVVPGAVALAAGYAVFGLIAGPGWTALRWGLGAILGGLVGMAVFTVLTLGAVWLGTHRRRATDLPLSSWRLLGWYHRLLMTHVWHVSCGWLLRSLGLYRFAARGMGMHIGRATMINSTHIYDHELITLGDRVLIGGDAWLLGHIAEQGRLERAPITIGDGSSVGLGAVVLPGAQIGRNCHVGAMSLVPKGAVLDDDAVYAGVPARKVQDLRPARPVAIAPT